MSSTSNPRELTEIAFRPDHATVYVSLELSRSKWLVTSLSAWRDKMSKHSVDAGDGAALLERLARLRMEAEQRLGTPARVVVIQEAGLDGFWIHRLLEAGGIESHVVEPASIAVPRLAAFKRGEPRVCSMVVAPSPEDEGRRRVSRERRTLIKERIEHANRIKGLLASQGIFGGEPMRRSFRDRLESLRTGDGRPLGLRLKAEIGRELDRMDLVLRQIAAVEADRDALVRPDHADVEAPAARLMKLRGIGPEFAAVLWLEGLFRRFANRRRLAAYAGLAPSPWQSGRVE